MLMVCQPKGAAQSDSPEDTGIAAPKQAPEGSLAWYLQYTVIPAHIT